MTPPYSASRLRADLYRLLDRVLETGVPLEVERRGRRLKIVAADSPRRLANLARDPTYLVADPDDLVHVDWSGEWRP
jgi:hypothetical protein